MTATIRASCARSLGQLPCYLRRSRKVFAPSVVLPDASHSACRRVAACSSCSRLSLQVTDASTWNAPHPACRTTSTPPRRENCASTLWRCERRPTLTVISGYVIVISGSMPRWHHSATSIALSRSIRTRHYSTNRRACYGADGTSRRAERILRESGAGETGQRWRTENQS